MWSTTVDVLNPYDAIVTSKDSLRIVIKIFGMKVFNNIK